MSDAFFAGVLVGLSLLTMGLLVLCDKLLGVQR
jgi:hypothetical protein